MMLNKQGRTNLNKIKKKKKIKLNCCFILSIMNCNRMKSPVRKTNRIEAFPIVSKPFENFLHFEKKENHRTISETVENVCQEILSFRLSTSLNSSST